MIWTTKDLHSVQTPLPVRPDGLPDFARPPVVEVALSIQFASLAPLNSARMGVFWGGLRDRFPIASEQAPFPPAFETFGGLQTLSPPFQFQAFFAPPTPRFWFESQDGTEVLQLQQDRMTRNWRKQEASAEYPRYEDIRGKLWNDAQYLAEFLDTENIGRPLINQCEVTYVNMVELPDGSSPQSALDRVTTLWASRKGGGVPGNFENAGLQARYVLVDQGKPYGRVYVNLSPVHLAADFSPAVRLELTARGKPEGEDLAAAFLLLDRHRETIVRTFDAITKPELHEFWGKRE